MRHEARIKAAMEIGEIRNIVIIDDAFDPPVLGDADAGPMLEFLENTSNEKTFKKAGLLPDEISSAIESITSSEYTSDQLTVVISKLYGRFVETFDERFDPSGRFMVIKGDNLRRIRPLLILLKNCGKISITRIGSDAGQIDFSTLKPDAIFVDYYLDGQLSPSTAPDPEVGNEKRGASLSMLRQVLAGRPGAGPSIMLMSSHSVRKQADKFRKDIQSNRKIFASRFQYVSKDDFDQQTDGSIKVKYRAAESLLDIAQHHKFAAAVEGALTQWRVGVDSAIDNVWSKITDLDLKDYAYLARFRLAEEGQPLSSYLEWFFGEVLVDSIARSVNWNDKSFEVLDQGAEKKKPGSQIEGAFDGSTIRIAELYYRARIDARPDRQGKDLRTGDLYIHSERPEEILATITPECDLVQRRNKRQAKRITAVAGTIQPLDAPDSSIGDFIKQGNMLANIVWNTKDIRTVEYDKIGDNEHRLIGTLRPVYAFELQRRVLNDLGRVGLAVAPAVAMTAKATVTVSGATEPIVLNISRKTGASCVVVPKRGPSDKARVIYHRSFATELLDEMLRIAAARLSEGAATALKSLQNPDNQAQFIEKLCREGQNDGDQAFGVLSTILPQRGKQPDAWCQILISLRTAEEMEQSLSAEA